MNFCTGLYQEQLGLGLKDNSEHTSSWTLLTIRGKKSNNFKVVNTLYIANKSDNMQRLKIWSLQAIGKGQSQGLGRKNLIVIIDQDL